MEPISTRGIKSRPTIRVKVLARIWCPIGYCSLTIHTMYKMTDKTGLWGLAVDLMHRRHPATILEV